MTLRVFLVEDSPVIRDNLTATLQELAPVEIVGFADNESKALDWIDANGSQCDIVIVDMFLKSGSGLGVLRESVAHPHLCKLVLSNYATLEIRAKCLALGAARVFDKSTEIEALVDYCARFDAGETAPSPL